MGALAVEQILEGSALERKAAARDLLSGLGARLTRASELERPGSRDPLATRVEALDRLLAGGLPRGSLTEVAGRRSCGRFSIGIASLAAATSAGESAALVDLGGHLDPQSAADAGVDLERLLWVRPSKLKEAVASAEMLLSAGFPLVVVDLGLPPVRGRYVPDAAWVRLTRAARDRRAALLLLAPYRVSGIAAETAVSMDGARAVWRGAGKSPRLLDGVEARLRLEKSARARGDIVEAMTLSIAGTIPLFLPSPPVGGRGTFSPPPERERAATSATRQGGHKGRPYEPGRGYVSWLGETTVARR